MSHIAKIEIEIKDLSALKNAAKRLGGAFVENQKTYQWYGRLVGGGPPLPEGFAESDLGKCEHAIRVPRANYEIGVCSRRDNKPGYTLLWDFWGPGGLPQAIGAKGQKLIQAYGVEAAKNAAKRQGYAVQETTKQDGSIVLTVQTGA